MKKLKRPAIAVLPAIAALSLLAACEGLLEPPPAASGAAAGAGGKGRVLISIAGAEDSPAPETAQSAAVRTLLPEFGILTYTLTITKTGETEPVFAQPIMETSVILELEAGTYTVSANSKNAGGTIVAAGSKTVAVDAGLNSAVTLKLTYLGSGTGILQYAVTVPPNSPVNRGVIEFFSLSGGPNPPILDLTAEGFTGTLNLSAGYYRAVPRVDVLGKKVAKTLIIHIVQDAITEAEFSFLVGDFIPAPPDGGSVIYIGSQNELAAIGDHIASEAMNYGKNAYVLLNDITLDGTWTPVGDEANPFEGYFFGENYRVTGLTLPDVDAARKSIGLFGAVHKALIRDLAIETADFSLASLAASTGYYIGLAAGIVDESKLAHITLEPGDITINSFRAADYYIGGAAGSLRNNSEFKNIAVSGGSLSLVHNAASNLPNVYAGGIAGKIDSTSEIAECGSSLDIEISDPGPGYFSGNSSVGGLAGANQGMIGESYYAGTLLGDLDSETHAGFGGIAGSNGGLIINCYTICVVNVTEKSGALYTGGVAGYNTGLVERCYAAGALQSIAGAGQTGGISPCYSGADFFGRVIASVSLLNSIESSLENGTRIGTPPQSATDALENNVAFNNMFVNGLVLSDAASNPQNDVNGLGKTAAQLKTQAVYEAGLGWDFAAVWEMGPLSYPYPILKRQGGAVPVPPDLEPLPDGTPRFEADIYVNLGEEINLTATVLAIYKDAYPQSLVITAPAGYDLYQWFVDGRAVTAGTQLGINAANYAVGGHHISAIVYRGTIPYLKNIEIHVGTAP
jgi:hypothetical protein